MGSCAAPSAKGDDKFITTDYLQQCPLGLVTNAVVLWNTIYMQAALDHLRAQGETLNDEDIARLSPLCHGHINMLGHYSFTLAELVTKGHLRPLKEASEAENVA
ncbi:transposase [Klebsiella pneumoniae]|nr:transposase [Klebsiella pneumoniae]